MNITSLKFKLVATESEYSQESSYGIAAYQNGVLLEVAEDISQDHNVVCAIVDKLNANDVYAVHFSQIVEDFLLDFEI